MKLFNGGVVSDMDYILNTSISNPVSSKQRRHNMGQSHVLDNIKYRKNDSVFRSVSKRGSSAQFFPYPTQFSSNFYIKSPYSLIRADEDEQ